MQMVEKKLDTIKVKRQFEFHEEPLIKFKLEMARTTVDCLSLEAVMMLIEAGLADVLMEVTAGIWNHFRIKVQAIR